MLATVRIVAFFVATVIVVMVVVPGKARTAAGQVVERHSMRVQAMIAVIVQQQPVGRRYAREQHENQRRRHRFLPC